MGPRVGLRTLPDRPCADLPGAQRGVGAHGLPPDGLAGCPARPERARRRASSSCSRARAGSGVSGRAVEATRARRREARYPARARTTCVLLTSRRSPRRPAAPPASQCCRRAGYPSNHSTRRHASGSLRTPARVVEEARWLPRATAGSGSRRGGRGHCGLAADQGASAEAGRPSSGLDVGQAAPGSGRGRARCQPKVKQYASAPAAVNSISNRRSTIGSGWRTSW